MNPSYFSPRYEHVSTTAERSAKNGVLGRYRIKRIALFFSLLMLFCDVVALPNASGQVGINATINLQDLITGSGPVGYPHSYKIATLHQDDANGYAHLRVMATLNINENYNANSYIDATFQIRSGYSAEYSLHGAPVNSGATLRAYINSVGQMDVYLYLADGFVLGDWAILNEDNTVLYSNPPDTQGSMPGTLIFDASNTDLYPPITYTNFASSSPNSQYMGIGTTNAQSNLTVAQGLTVDLNDDDSGNTFINGYSGNTLGVNFGLGSGEGIGSARVNGAPNQYGLDFYTSFSKQMSLTNSGRLGIGTASPASKLEVNGDTKVDGALYFSDGSAFTSANNIKLQSLQVGGGSSGTGAIIAGTNLDPNGHSSFVGNLPNSGTLLQGWNYSGGGGEQDFIGNRGGGGAGGFRFYDDDNGGNLTPLVTMLGNGNVGIGTLGPNAKLEVDGNLLLTYGSGASITFQDGSIQTTAYRGNCSATGGDYAESVDVTGDHTLFQPGDVMVIDPEHPGHFLKSASRYSTLVAGIYSTKPGYVGRRQISTDSSAEVPMAMVGIVPTKVTAENGPIKVGDLVVTSSTAGYAMHGTNQASITGAIVGKALGKLDSGTGVIEVLVSLQ